MPRTRRGPPADGYDAMVVVQRGCVYIINGAWRLAGITQRRAIDESEGRLSVEEPQLPAPCSVYVLGYSDAEGDLRDDAEDREGEWGCEAYDLSDGNAYEEYADSLVAQVEIGGYESSNPSPTGHLVLSSS